MVKLALFSFSCLQMQNGGGQNHGSKTQTICFYSLSITHSMPCLAHTRTNNNDKQNNPQFMSSDCVTRESNYKKHVLCMNEVSVSGIILYKIIMCDWNCMLAELQNYYWTRCVIPLHLLIN